MPLAGIDRIVIDPLRCAEACPAVGTAGEHHVGRATSGRHHTGQHINVVVGWATGTIDREEKLPAKPDSIYSALDDAATHVDWGHLIKSRRLVPDLRIARTNTVKRRAPAGPATDKKVAVGGHIERSKYRPVRNIDRRLPGDAAVGGALELHAAAATVNTVVGLVLEAVSRAVGLIDGEPLLVAAARASIGGLFHPCLAAAGRAPEVVAKKGLVNVRLETEIEEIAHLIGLCHRVAAEHVILQNTRERPMHAAIGGITPAALPEVGQYAVKLSPGDCHLVPIGRINGNRALVSGVAEDIVAILINVDLETDERAELRDHSRRSLYLPWWRRRVIVKFQRPVPWRLARGRQCLARGAGQCEQEDQTNQ